MDQSKDSRPIMVSIRCATYNHAHYIRQCLDGFVMQKTNFRFEAIVHDDASTDGTTEIVREYADKYPDIIVPMYETENQYSKNLVAMNDAINNKLVGKYVAICEGDDYWTDPLKLQKQFDYMESHPDCSLCFHPHYCLYSDGQMVPHTQRIKKEIYSVCDLIWRGNEFMATNSMFFPRDYYLASEERPDFWKYSHVGDEPLTLYLALNGKVCYINELSSVYRIMALGSWTAGKQSIQKELFNAKKCLLMFHRFNQYTKFRYSFIIFLKEIRIIIRGLRGVLRTIH